MEAHTHPLSRLWGNNREPKHNTLVMYVHGLNVIITPFLLPQQHEDQDQNYDCYPDQSPCVSTELHHLTCGTTECRRGKLGSGGTNASSSVAARFEASVITKSSGVTAS
jgi:hypothetical protein